MGNLPIQTIKPIPFHKKNPAKSAIAQVGKIGGLSSEQKLAAITKAHAKLQGK